MIMIELEALNWSFQLLLYIQHDFGHVKSRRQKRPSHHAYRFCVLKNGTEKQSFCTMFFFCGSDIGKDFPIAKVPV